MTRGMVRRRQCDWIEGETGREGGARQGGLAWKGIFMSRGEMVVRYSMVWHTMTNLHSTSMTGITLMA
jgi:hypothetical protein